MACLYGLWRGSSAIATSTTIGGKHVDTTAHNSNPTFSRSISGNVRVGDVLFLHELFPYIQYFQGLRESFVLNFSRYTSGNVHMTRVDIKEGRLETPFSSRNSFLTFGTLRLKYIFHTQLGMRE